MATVTLSSIQQRAREITDRVGSAFFSSSEMDSYTDAAVAEFYDFLTAQMGPGYLLTWQDLSVIAESTSWNLPTDFYKLRGLSIKVSSSPERWIELPTMSVDLANTEYAPRSWVIDANGTTLRAVVRGSVVDIYPQPTAQALTLRVWYIPNWDTTASSLFSQNGWEEHVVLGIAIRMSAKAREDANLYLGLQQKIEKRIRAHAQTVNPEPTVIKDVDPNGDFYRRRGRYLP